MPSFKSLINQQTLSAERRFNTQRNARKLVVTQFEILCTYCNGGVGLNFARTKVSLLGEIEAGHILIFYQESEDYTNYNLVTDT